MVAKRHLTFPKLFFTVHLSPLTVWHNELKTLKRLSGRRICGFKVGTRIHIQISLFFLKFPQFVAELSLIPQNFPFKGM